MQTLSVKYVRKYAGQIPGAIASNGEISFTLGKQAVCLGVITKSVKDLPKTLITFDDFKKWPQGYIAIASAGRTVRVLGAANEDFALIAPATGSPFKALEEVAGFKGMVEMPPKVEVKVAPAEKIENDTVLKALAEMLTSHLNGQRRPGRPRKPVVSPQ